jgi:Cation efflux family
VTTASINGKGQEFSSTAEVWAYLEHSKKFLGLLTSQHSLPNTALEADRAGQRALWLSMAGLAVTAARQGDVVVASGSAALLGDTLHNIADALTALPLLVAFRLARRPANTRYTYGYGRAEDFAGLFVVVMIALSSVLAGYAAHRSAPESSPGYSPSGCRGRGHDRIGRKRAGRGLPHPRRPADRLRRACWTRPGS